MLTLILLLNLAQEFTYDINGRRSASPASLNGRAIDTTKVEEKVVEQSGGRKVIERIVRHTNPDGTPIASEKIRIEETTHADGRVTTAQETYRSDLNGRMSLAEKSLTDYRKSGNSIESTTTVSRATVNGGLELVERAEMTGREDDKSKLTDTRIFRRDTNGTFRENARNVVEQRQENGKTVENATEYQSATIDGQLRLSGQKVTSEEKAQDGSSVKLVRIYGIAQAGRPSEGDLKLREEQQIRQQQGPSKTVQEDFSIRRPDLTGNLPKAFTPISQRTCQDKCN